MDSQTNQQQGHAPAGTTNTVDTSSTDTQAILTHALGEIGRNGFKTLPSTLPPFSKGHALSARAWLEAIALLGRIHGDSNESLVIKAVIHTQEPMLSWGLQYITQVLSRREVLQWEPFCEEFRHLFGGSDQDIFMLRERIKKLSAKPHSDPLDFYREFETLWYPLLGKLSDADRFYMFWDQCPHWISVKLVEHSVTSWPMVKPIIDKMSLTWRTSVAAGLVVPGVGAAHRRKHVTTSDHVSSPDAATSRASTSSNQSMAMDIASLAVGNKNKRQCGTCQAKDHRTIQCPQTGGAGRDGCFRCGKGGHISRTCSKGRGGGQPSVAALTVGARELTLVAGASAPRKESVPVRDVSSLSVPDHDFDIGRLPDPFVVQSVSGGVTLSTLVDSGCNLNAITSGALERIRKVSPGSIKKYEPFETPPVGDAANMTDIAFSGAVVLTFTIGEFTADETFYCTSTLGQDVYLGLTWMRKYEPEIQFKKEVMSWKVKGVLYTVAARNRIAPRVIDAHVPRVASLISKRAIERSGRNKTKLEFGLLFLRPTMKGKSVEFDSAMPTLYSVTLDDSLSKKPCYDELAQVVREFEDSVFTPLSSLPPSRPYDHKIPTGSAPAVYKRAYKMSPLELRVLREQLDELLAKGFIRPSTSPWASPVLFVKKGDGSLRLCVDYRALNSVTTKNRYPLPLIEEFFDRFTGAAVFSRLDLESAFNQVLVDPPDVEKTAFNTRYGHFEYLVMPFGVTGGPATCQTMTNDILREFMDEFVVVFLDDILIFSKDKESHVEHVRKVLEALLKAQLHVKPSKCEFGVPMVKFVGHVISGNGISVDPDKISVLREWPTPTNVQELRSFIGFVNYYRRFIRSFARISAPLTELLRTNGSDNAKKRPLSAWTPEHQAAMDTLIHKLTTAPILLAGDFSQPFFVETDASDIATGAVLYQMVNGRKHPVAYASKKLKPAEVNYPVHERELLAIVYACRMWRSYLLGSKVVVYTDHASLKYIFRQPHLSARMARWIQFLAPYELDIQYRRGVDNAAADALSRLRSSLNSVLMSSVLNTSSSAEDIVCESDWPLHYYAYFESGILPAGDAEAAKLIRDNAECFEVEEDVVYRLVDNKRVPFIPFINRADVLFQLHVGFGHLGQHGTFDLAATRVWWPSLRADVITMCRACPECQLVKGGGGGVAPLHPLEPARPFQRWGIDFVGVLPKTKNGNRWIITAIDYATNWPVARALPEATATAVADFIYEEIFMQFGVPAEIVSDRGANFMADTLRRYLDRMGTSHKLTSAYHPRANGKCERLNGLLGSMINKYVGKNRSSWDRYLLQALFACRVRIHTVTGYSPYKLTYGVDPVIPGDTNHPNLFDFQSEEDAQGHRAQQFAEIEEIRRRAYGLQTEAAADMRSRYEGMHKIEEGKFAVGDTVLVRNFGKKKWEKSFYGPLKVVRATPLHTYQLIWGDGRIKKDLVHQDRLKKAVLLEGEDLPAEPWYESRSSKDEDAMDNSEDGEADPEDAEERRIRDYHLQREFNERLDADQNVADNAQVQDDVPRDAQAVYQRLKARDEADALRSKQNRRRR